MKAPLWRCEMCRRQFANRNQSHACGRHDLAHHFAGKPPKIRALYRQVLAAARENGPVTVNPEKTRIALQVRMSFVALSPKKNWIDGHFVLARRVDHPRFRKVQTFSPRNHMHVFRLTDASEIDDEFRDWLRESYAVGEQKHLRA